MHSIAVVLLLLHVVVVVVADVVVDYKRRGEFIGDRSQIQFLVNR